MNETRQNILVTGGAGFIGSNLVIHLLEQSGCRVINLDKLTYAGNPASLGSHLHHPRHHFVHGDIADPTMLSDVFQRFHPDAVIHLAAETHVDRSIDGPAAFVQTNVCGTFSLLDAAHQYWQGLSEKERNIFRFLHVSTDEVHGSLSAHDPPFTESTSYAPRSPYSATKASADHLVRSWYHTYGFPAIVTNCSNNYGPRQFPEKLIPLAILKMLHGQDIPLYGDGRQIRDWLHVTDHCRALQMILQCGDIGGTYLVGSGREISNRELLLKLCEAMDETQPRLDRQSHAVAITHVVDRPGHDQRYAIDSSHIRQTLGWHPQNNLDAGLRDTINWYLNNRGWWRDILSGTYAMQRLGHIP
jgi:dTDP-glucose 4,6-dehydratase